MASDSIGHRLHTGRFAFEFIRNRRWWYALSGAVIILGIVSLAVRGLNPSIDFKGGAVFEFPAHSATTTSTTRVLNSVGVQPDEVQLLKHPLNKGEGASIRVETGNLSTAKINKVQNTIGKRFDVKATDVAVSTVGATWGSQVTTKAVTGLIVFLVLLVVYLSIRFEWKYAVAAIIGVLHDLVVTAGIYSLVGFQVSPSTVIALLTILGYSLYDNVVVFDKVRENTHGLTNGSRMTFSQASNLAVNQTLIRSINTTLAALLPVAGLLFVGAGLLGAGSLKDLSLALFIGLFSGAYSSIFLATPLLCDFKEREPVYQQLARRVAARQGRRAKGGAVTGAEPAAATESSGGAAISGDAAAARTRRAGDGNGSRSAMQSSNGAEERARDDAVEVTIGAPGRYGEANDPPTALPHRTSPGSAPPPGASPQRPGAGGARSKRKGGRGGKKKRR